MTAMNKNLESPAEQRDVTSSTSYTRGPCSPKQFTLFDLSEPLLSLPPLTAESGNYGEVFTRRWIVDLILDLVGYDPASRLSERLAIEPACGHGAFLLPMVERLINSCASQGVPLADAAGAIRAYDLIAENVQVTRTAVANLLSNHGADEKTADRLSRAWIRQGDFLLGEHAEEIADFVVGNPPYIRLEDIPEARSDAYRRACLTMSGRADVFVGFYERGLRALKSEGRLAYICADRWMRNAYGKSLRALVASEYAVEASIAMHDVDAFESQVSAYPAVTVIRAGEQGAAVIADTTSAFGKKQASTLASWFKQGAGDPLHRPGLTAAWLGHWFTTQAGWPTGSPDRLALVAELEDRFPLLEETGAKVGIGLASGADDIYVTKEPVAEEDRLLPMVMRSDISSGEIVWSGHHLVNPWEPEGLVDLARFPKMAAHFQKDWKRIADRNVGKKNPGREHRTIDRVIEGLSERPKLLLADMSSRIWPVLDQGRFYPHHNLYWIHEDNSDWDLEVLGGILLSDVAELFISTYCVRMRGGTLRFQAQYLRRIRVPRYSDIDVADRELLRAAFKSRDTVAATEHALKLYGIPYIPA